MTKFFAGVLSVIALGVLLIAYGLLVPRANAYSDQGTFARPMLAHERVMLRDDPNAAYPVSAAQAPYAPAYVYADRVAQPAPYGYAYQPVAAPVAAPVRTVTTVQDAPRPTTRVVERAPRRDWKKTALVIGGSTATGAGVGAMFGGKKGALIGAAIGGGASTIYESTK
jgi:hypothetical protein